MEQTVTRLGSLEFPTQALPGWAWGWGGWESSQGCGLELLEITPVFIQVLQAKVEA